MTYSVRFGTFYYSVGFWIDENRWIESSNWFSPAKAQEECDRLNANLEAFKRQETPPQQTELWSNTKCN